MLIAAVQLSAQELPSAYSPIDKNGDKVIQVQEVQSVIDSFFMSDTEHSVEFIHFLIDYFFEQKD